MHGKHSIILCSLSFNNVSVRTFTLVESGATGFAFVDKEFASLHSIRLQELKTPHHIEGIEGRPIDPGVVTHIAWLGLLVHGHEEEALVFFTSIWH